MLESILNSLCLHSFELIDRVDLVHGKIDGLEKQFDLFYYYNNQIKCLSFNSVALYKDNFNYTIFRFHHYPNKNSNWYMDDLKLMEYMKSWWLIDKEYKDLFKDITHTYV